MSINPSKYSRTIRIHMTQDFLYLLLFTYEKKNWSIRVTKFFKDEITIPLPFHLTIEQNRNKTKSRHKIINFQTIAFFLPLSLLFNTIHVDIFFCAHFHLCLDNDLVTKTITMETSSIRSLFCLFHVIYLACISILKACHGD